LALAAENALYITVCMNER